MAIVLVKAKDLQLEENCKGERDRLIQYLTARTDPTDVQEGESGGVDMSYEGPSWLGITSLYFQVRGWAMRGFSYCGRER